MMQLFSQEVSSITIKQSLYSAIEKIANSSEMSVDKKLNELQKIFLKYYTKKHNLRCDNIAKKLKKIAEATRKSAKKNGKEYAFENLKIEDIIENDRKFRNKVHNYIFTMLEKRNTFKGLLIKYKAEEIEQSNLSTEEKKKKWKDIMKDLMKQVKKSMSLLEEIVSIILREIKKIKE